jgi:hypothetical protein
VISEYDTGCRMELSFRGDRPLRAGRLRIQTHHPTALVVACWVGMVVVAWMAGLPSWMPVPSRLRVGLLTVWRSR